MALGKHNPFIISIAVSGIVLAAVLTLIASFILAVRAAIAGQTGIFVTLIIALPAMLSGAILEMMPGSNRVIARQMVRCAAKGAIVSMIIVIITTLVVTIIWTILWSPLVAVARTVSSLLVTLVTIAGTIIVLRVRRIAIIKLMPRIIKLTRVLAIRIGVEPPVVLAAVWIGWAAGFGSGLLFSVQVVDALR